VSKEHPYSQNRASSHGSVASDAQLWTGRTTVRRACLRDALGCAISAPGSALLARRPSRRAVPPTPWRTISTSAAGISEPENGAVPHLPSGPSPRPSRAIRVLQWADCTALASARSLAAVPRRVSQAQSGGARARARFPPRSRRARAIGVIAMFALGLDDRSGGFERSIALNPSDAETRCSTPGILGSDVGRGARSRATALTRFGHRHDEVGLRVVDGRYTDAITSSERPGARLTFYSAVELPYPARQRKAKRGSRRAATDRRAAQHSRALAGGSKGESVTLQGPADAGGIVRARGRATLRRTPRSVMLSLRYPARSPAERAADTRLHDHPRGIPHLRHLAKSRAIGNCLRGWACHLSTDSAPTLPGKFLPGSNAMPFHRQTNAGLTGEIRPDNTRRPACRRSCRCGYRTGPPPSVLPCSVLRREPICPHIVPARYQIGAAFDRALVAPGDPQRFQIFPAARCDATRRRQAVRSTRENATRRVSRSPADALHRKVARVPGEQPKAGRC
jgi:hypothetical protein